MSVKLPAGAEAAAGKAGHLLAAGWDQFTSVARIIYLDVTARAGIVPAPSEDAVFVLYLFAICFLLWKLVPLLLGRRRQHA